MMKKYFYVLLFMILSALTGCESSGDCFISAGERTEVALQVEDFTRLEINSYFSVTIRQGMDRSILLKTGKNLLDEIEYDVVDGIFSINDKNDCDWARKIHYPELIITSPNITEIRQNGGGLIRSEDVLLYPSLHLISENVSGDFDLIVDNNELQITSNSINNYHISGSVENLTVGFFAGDGRFEGHDLIAKNVNVHHSGSNEIIVYATESLRGRILATGNLVYLKTTPPVVDVSVESRGKLIHRPE